MDYRLGLDVGTNSLGWAVLELDENGEPCAIADAGSRIFNDGRNAKSKATLAATRQEKRSARRRRDRFKQRQTFLLSELTKAGLFPEDESEREALKGLDPLELRASALTEPLAPHEIGRAFFHINQRRGFKSNRKDTSEETTSGKVADSIHKLLADMELMEQKLSKEEYKELSKEEKKEVRGQIILGKKQALEYLQKNDLLTFGSFLWQRRRNKQPTRARTGNDKLYEFYPTRELLEDEFHKIWRAQARHHPNLLTEEAKERIHHAIFSQRPLKSQEIGLCTYMSMSGQKRAHRALPGFQRYRIYSEVNNLNWRTSQGLSEVKAYPEARDAIVEMLERVSTRNGQVSFNKIKNVLKQQGLAEGNIELNLESDKRKGLDGNATSRLMQQEDCVGEQWHEWPPDQQDAFVTLLLSDKEDEEVLAVMQSEYGLDDVDAQTCLEASSRLPEGTGNLSLKAAQLLEEKMRDDCLIQPDAVCAVAKDREEQGDFRNPLNRTAGSEELLDELPYYGEAFQETGHIIPGDNKLQEYESHGDKRKYYGGVSNVTVHIALNQIRALVNELIRRYGRPASIAIEMARELPMGVEKKREEEKRQRENQEQNERFDRILREHGRSPNRENRLRLRLWEELDEDPSGRMCPFSGSRIGIADLFNGNTEIEHLLPFSRSLDDSRANKVLCTRQANRDKGQQGPYEAFHNRAGYNWGEIIERAQRLPKAKQWRFYEDAWNKYDEQEGFLKRHLNDTAYIGRLAKEYLENICLFNKINVLTGSHTALLRRYWGLNSLLRDSNQPEQQKKNRDDHRHHALDAMVVAMTTFSMLQKMSKESSRAEEVDLEHLFPKDHNGRSPIDPWDGFRSDAKKRLDRVVVSHRVRRKRAVLAESGKSVSNRTTGQLHNETAYGIISGPDKTGKYKVVSRWPIDKLKKKDHLKNIRDPYQNKRFLEVWERAEEAGKKGKDAIKQFAVKEGIRSLRCTKSLSGVVVKNRQGKAYKFLEGDSNWAAEIYEYPPGHSKAGKWYGEVITTHEANQPGFRPGQTYRPHPGARLVMRLQINDCVRLDDQIMRLQKISKGFRLVFVPALEANVDARHNDPQDDFSFKETGIRRLQDQQAQKVHISPSGRINSEVRLRKP